MKEQIKDYFVVVISIKSQVVLSCLESRQLHRLYSRDSACSIMCEQQINNSRAGSRKIDQNGSKQCCRDIQRNYHDQELFYSVNTIHFGLYYTVDSLHLQHRAIHRQHAVSQLDNYTTQLDHEHIMLKSTTRFSCSSAIWTHGTAPTNSFSLSEISPPFFVHPETK